MNGAGCIASIMRAAAPLAVIGCAAAILLRFPPGLYGFYPQCPVNEFLHIQCPGCGTTRALAALLHGHAMEALRLNALTTTLLPVAVAYAAVCYRRYLRREALRLPRLPPAGIYAALAAASIFTIVRNLPLELL